MRGWKCVLGLGLFMRAAFSSVSRLEFLIYFDCVEIEFCDSFLAISWFFILCSLFWWDIHFTFFFNNPFATGLVLKSLLSGTDFGVYLFFVETWDLEKD